MFSPSPVRAVGPGTMYHGGVALSQEEADFRPQGQERPFPDLPPFNIIKGQTVGGVEYPAFASRVSIKSSVARGRKCILGVEQCRFCLGLPTVQRGRMHLGGKRIQVLPRASHKFTLLYCSRKSCHRHQCHGSVSHVAAPQHILMCK